MARPELPSGVLQPWCEAPCVSMKLTTARPMSRGCSTLEPIVVPRCLILEERVGAGWSELTLLSPGLRVQWRLPVAASVGTTWPGNPLEPSKPGRCPCPAGTPGRPRPTLTPRSRVGSFSRRCRWRPATRHRLEACSPSGTRPKLSLLVGRHPGFVVAAGRLGARRSRPRDLFGATFRRPHLATCGFARPLADQVSPVPRCRFP